MSLDFDLEVRREAHRWHLKAALPDGPNILVGPSGAGKTTLLEAVAGLLEPEAGFVRLGRRSLTDVAARVFVAPHKRGLGFGFQDDRLFPQMTVRNNLTFGLKHRSAGPLTIDEVVDALELKPLLGRHPEALSGGEKKRVGVGRALLAARSGLLLDEPFAGLNPQLARTVAEFVVRAAAQISGPTLIATHHQDMLPPNLPTMVLTQGHLESGQSVPG